VIFNLMKIDDIAISVLHTKIEESICYKKYFSEWCLLNPVHLEHRLARRCFLVQSGGIMNFYIQLARVRLLLLEAECSSHDGI